MTPHGGYTGKLLFVDLTTQKLKEETRDDDYYRKYLGGYGIGVEVLFRMLKKGKDPLGKDNILGFTTGLFTATNAPFSGRYAVVGKSPLTNGWGDANSGGFFGPMLKKAGYDAVFFTGAAKEPVYLWLDNGKAELRDAKALWGKDCYETEELIKADVGEKKLKTASIGPAGEKLVRFACIINDNGRAAGRSGLGAVMGAKNLKAVAVFGNQKPLIHNHEEFAALRKEIISFYKSHPVILGTILPWIKPVLGSILKRGIWPPVDKGTEIDLFKKHGTTAMAAISSQCGDSPIKNWKGVGYRDFPMLSKANRISDVALDKYKLKKYACQSCPIGCGAVFKLDASVSESSIKSGETPIPETHRPEYETISEFGMMILNDDPEIIIRASDLCNRYGMDTISAGSTVAFAFECFERGIISSEQLNGLKLRWGDGRAALQLLELINNREGAGDILAEGTMRAAETFGGDAGTFAIHVGGQELPMHDPKLNPGFATTYLTDPTPGRHTQGGTGFFEWGMVGSAMKGLKLPKVERYEYSGKGYTQAMLSRMYQLINTLGLCMFSVQFTSYPLVEMVNAVTGWGVTTRELLDTGERIQALRQAFNVREGIIASKLPFPDRALGKPPLRMGPTAFVTVDIETMAREYYDEMKWDWETGKPQKERLMELGLDFVAKELYGK